MAGIPDEAIQELLGARRFGRPKRSTCNPTGGAEQRAADNMDEIFGAAEVNVAVKKINSGAR